MKNTPVSKIKVSNRLNLNGGNEVEAVKTRHQTVQITPPKIERATFEIIGTAPLVIHRFSQKAKNGMLATMVAGSVSKKGKKREPLDVMASSIKHVTYRLKAGMGSTLPRSVAALFQPADSSDSR
jgi:hypothetical protein